MKKSKGNIVLEIIQKYYKQIIVVIFLCALFFRTYKLQELFLYGHDQDLAGWFIRDVIDNKHPRLIGQETSTQGIYIGPLYYYFLIPFYALTGFKSTGGLVAITILGFLSIFSFYWVFTKMYSKTVGLIALIIYSFSTYTIFNDREVVPTMPVLMWSVWFFYSLHLIIKNEYKKALLIVGILVGTIWHLNFALIIIAPLWIVALFLSKKWPTLKDFIPGVIAAVVLLTPLVLFELRHSFLQVNSFITALTTDQHDIISGYEKFLRVLHLSGKNLTGLIWGNLPVKYEYVLVATLCVFAFLSIKRIIPRTHAILLTLWIFFYISFFSLYSKTVSEYYLNGLMVAWVCILSVFLGYLIESKKLWKLGVVILLLFIVINTKVILDQPINRSSYMYKVDLIKHIKEHSYERGYPCVAISYITNPGYEFGYRYLFVQEGLRVEKPGSGAPVYSIIFPLKNIFREDVSFGALGLIYPDPISYTDEGIQKACDGVENNVTEPMWGMPI